MAAHFSDLVSQYGSLAVFLLMTLESACIPIPSEAVMTFAGYMSSQAHLTFWSVVIVGTCANVFGGLIAYYVGRTGGRAFVLRFGRYILLNEHHLERAEAWFEKRGEVTVFIGRVLPVIRTFISLPAGMAKMKLGRFILYSALGCLPWNFALTLAGYQLGSHWETVSHYIKPLTYFGAAVFILAVVWFWFGRKSRESRKSGH